MFKGGGDSRSRRERFVEGLCRRFLLRGYMTWIILATSAAGVTMNAVLFHFGMSELGLRTFLSIVPCYFVFLLQLPVFGFAVSPSGGPAKRFSPR